MFFSKNHHNEQNIDIKMNLGVDEMKTAIITGASSGMGREFAIQIAKNPSIQSIWLIARNQKKLDSVSKFLMKRHPRLDIQVMPLDLSKEASFWALEKELQDQQPEVSILFNNAGFGLLGFFDELCLEDQLSMIDVNVAGVVRITHFVIPYMHPKSTLYLMASAAAFLAQPNFAVYASTKAFVLHFGKALQYELLSKKIQVTIICPGPVKTNFFSIASPDHQPIGLKKFFMASPKKVVEKARSDAAKGKLVSIYGVWMNLVIKIAPFIPYKVMGKLMLTFFSSKR